MSTPLVYFALLLSLLLAGYIVFRAMARADYTRQGHLSRTCSLLELLIWLAFIALPWVFNPPCWWLPWACPAWTPAPVATLARVVVALGALAGFGSMAWLGIGRSFGRLESALHTAGPYRWSRNPQIVGGTTMVAGIGLLWPSLYALGWLALWVALGHWMVVTEEEHLGRVLGQAYRQYCERVPRYLGRLR